MKRMVARNKHYQQGTSDSEERNLTASGQSKRPRLPSDGSSGGHIDSVLVNARSGASDVGATRQQEQQQMLLQQRHLLQLQHDQDSSNRQRAAAASSLFAALSASQPGAQLQQQQQQHQQQSFQQPNSGKYWNSASTGSDGDSQRSYAQQLAMVAMARQQQQQQQQQSDQDYLLLHQQQQQQQQRYNQHQQAMVAELLAQQQQQGRGNFLSQSIPAGTPTSVRSFVGTIPSLAEHFGLDQSSNVLIHPKLQSDQNQIPPFLQRVNPSVDMMQLQWEAAALAAASPFGGRGGTGASGASILSQLPPTPHHAANVNDPTSALFANYLPGLPATFASTTNIPPNSSFQRPANTTSLMGLSGGGISGSANVAASTVTAANSNQRLTNTSPLHNHPIQQQIQHEPRISSPKKPRKTHSGPTALQWEANKNVPMYDPGPVKELSLPSDKGNLSEYQCLLREQIQLFAVSLSDIQCSAQGRNRPIQLGQVGILCRHCAPIPPGMRPCGAAYFPARLSGVYQASQNMAINHFSKSCRNIPPHVKTRLLKLKEQKSTVLGGGKHFWANGCRVVGVYEDDGVLRFREDAEKDVNKNNAQMNDTSVNSKATSQPLSTANSKERNENSLKGT